MDGVLPDFVGVFYIILYYYYKIHFKCYKMVTQNANKCQQEKKEKL
jgi:hypothetical protein